VTVLAELSHLVEALTPLGDHVSGVVTVSACEQMRRAHASAVVTGMADQLAFTKLAHEEPVAHTMSQLLLALQAETGVPLDGGPLHLPATVILIVSPLGGSHLEAFQGRDGVPVAAH
jgi:hypothetical protein